MEITTLTPAELDLIRIKREEEVLANQRKEAERKAEQEKRINEEVKRIETAQTTNEKLNAEIKDLFVALNAIAPNQYSLVTVAQKKDYELYHYDNINVKEVYWKRSIELSVCKVMHGKITITAHEYYTSSGRSSFSARQVYEGVRYKLDIPSLWDRKNDNLKSAKTINEKIQSHIKASIAKKVQAETKQSGIDFLKDKVTSMFPTAGVTVQRAPGYYLDPMRRREFREGEQFVKVIFANGFEMHYHFRIQDNEFKEVRTAIVTSMMSQEDQEALVNQFAK